MLFRKITENARLLTRRKILFLGAAGILLLTILSCLAGDASENIKEKARSYYELSDDAQRVSGLLDRGANEAAGGILHAKIPQHPDDAGLHVQYARYLVLSRSVAHPGEVYTPLDPRHDNLWHPVGAAIEAGNRAMQLDPNTKSYLSAVLMTALQERITEELEAGNGIIGGSWFGNASGGGMDPDGFQTSMVGIAWTALKADPKTAAAFATDFRKLMEKSIELGKVPSAAMLGNLLGDLENEGKDNSHDFEYACDAFERALPHYAGPGQALFGLEIDWVKVTINWMRRSFTPELADLAKGERPVSYQRLEKALHTRGLAVVETPEFLAGREDRKTLP